MSRLTRADLDALPAYVPGRSVADLARELGIAEAVKLASNEVPFGPLPGVPEAVAAAMTQSHRYPDMGVLELRDRLAERYGVTPDRIVTGCGSVALAEHLAKATCLPGDEIVYSWRSFEAYPIISAGVGATSIRVPNNPGHGHDLPAMAEAITDRTRLAIVCNPNNPTGTSVRKAELDRFLDAVPSDVLVVLDEAYREFVTDPDVPDGVELMRGRPNVAVLRTFSKAYGLAGLRVGFLVGHEPVAEAARKTLLPFAVNRIAQAAAIASLAAEPELLARVEQVVKQRTRVRDELLAQGWSVPPTEANFVWLRLSEDTADFAAACARSGVSIRPFAGEGARISVGDEEDNEAFLAAARAYPRRH